MWNVSDDVEGRHVITLAPDNRTVHAFDLFKIPDYMVGLLSTAYLLVFILSVVNNSLVIAVIFRDHKLRTVTNYFIANLAVADILVTILVLPLTLLQSIYTEWLFGPFTCRAMAYMQGVSVAASVNTLAAIAVERYLAIFYPRTSRLTPYSAGILMIFIWVIPICIMIPWPIVYRLKVFHIPGALPLAQCVQEWNFILRKTYTVIVFLACYLFPLAFISIFYMLIGMRVWKRQVRGMRGTRAQRNIHRSKLRVVKMLVVVFVIFALSWLPFYCLQLGLLFAKGSTTPYVRRLLRRYIIPVTQWLGSANSCMNPFVYCYFSQPFRSGILSLLRSNRCSREDEQANQVVV